MAELTAGEAGLVEAQATQFDADFQLAHVVQVRVCGGWEAESGGQSERAANQITDQLGLLDFLFSSSKQAAGQGSTFVILVPGEWAEPCIINTMKEYEILLILFITSFFSQEAEH